MYEFSQIEEIPQKPLLTGSDLVFKNVGVTVENKCILNDISGLAESGKLLAIIGPSGAGKTTLLSCLAGRLPVNQGEITLNGTLISKNIKRKCCYVLQQDVFFPSLSLRDTLMFAASMKLSDKMSLREKTKQVLEIVESLDLSKCLDTMVGGDMMLGLSGGERKRANIACELLTNPSLILLDEPTTGLDSSSAYSLISNLKEYAKTNLKTVIATIHQPSTQLFYLFDSLLLLCQGKQVYYGTTEDVITYFDDIGMAVSPGYNPADFIMEKLKEDEDTQKRLFKALQDLKSSNSWPLILSSRKQSQSKHDILESPTLLDKFMFDTEPEGNENDHKWPTGFFTQYKHLMKRTFQLSKPRILDKVKIVENLLICAIVCLIWFQLPRSEETLRDRMGAVFFIAVHWGFIPLFDAVTSFPIERIVISKERASGWYRLSAYYLAKMTSELPLILVQPLFFVVLAYWCIGLNGVSAFFATLGTIFIDALAGQSVGLFLGIINTEIRQAITVTILIEMCIMILAGLFTRTLPVWLNWAKYLSFVYYSFHGLMVLEFENGEPVSCSRNTNQTAFIICKDGNLSKIPSEYILDYFDVRWDFWQYLLPLLLYILLFRSLGYIALRWFHRPQF